MTNKAINILGQILAKRTEAEGMTSANMQCIEGGHAPPYGDHHFFELSEEIKELSEQAIASDNLQKLDETAEIEVNAEITVNTSFRFNIDSITEV